LKSKTLDYKYWLPVLFWLTVIAIESFSLSSNLTGSWLARIFAALHIRMSAEEFAKLHHYLRKIGHVTGYGILCLLLFRAWFHTLSQDVSNRVRNLRARCAALAIGITLLTAVLDEWHQSFDPSRTASLRDIGLDVGGGFLSLLLALFVFRMWRRSPRREVEAVS
jgi:VanZ family protein